MWDFLILLYILGFMVTTAFIFKKTNTDIIKAFIPVYCMYTYTKILYDNLSNEEFNKIQL